MNHNRLVCYQVLLETAKTVPALLSQIPRGEHDLVDQLKRALTSAILNLSEGNGRTSQRERNRFFDISLASISEVSSAIDIIEAYSYITHEYSMKLKSQLLLAYKMIFKLKK